MVGGIEETCFLMFTTLGKSLTAGLCRTVEQSRKISQLAGAVLNGCDRHVIVMFMKGMHTRVQTRMGSIDGDAAVDAHDSHHSQE